MKFPYARFLSLTLFCVLATIVSVYFIDKEVAIRIWKISSSHPVLHKKFVDIPNTLPKLVAIASTVMWLAYCFIIQNKRTSPLHGFLPLAATAVPVAYLVKSFLQNACGRTNIRLWLRVGGPIEFRWFDPIESGGFPSGHALVFTAFFTALWLYYPKYRPLAILAICSLALALLFTSYHFVSDIFAGICCGILITTGIHYVFLRSRVAA